MTLKEGIRKLFGDAFSLSSDTASQEEIRMRLVDGAAVKGTNMCVLILAILIASIGLNMNSTAVIIGAMLISPLMGSIIAVAYGLALGNGQIVRHFFFGFLLQIAISLLTSTLYFSITPISSSTSELLARTQPTIWDVLIAFCGGLAGCIGSTRKDKANNVIPGVAIATALSVSSDMLIVMPTTIVCAILLLRRNGTKNVRGDAALAMLSVGALALGYLVLNVFSKSANLSADVCSTLFGSTSILTLKRYEVWLCVGMSALVVLLFTLFYHKIFAVTFDESFASATGTPTGVYDLLIAIVTAIVIVLSMNLVGSLLTSALIVFPTLSAMRVFKSYKLVVLCAAALSVLCAVSGILFSILASTPVGATIVAADLLAFLIFSILGRLKGK